MKTLTKKVAVAAGRTLDQTLVTIWMHIKLPATYFAASLVQSSNMLCKRNTYFVSAKVLQPIGDFSRVHMYAKKWPKDKV